jgi:hypothetical protein
MKTMMGYRKRTNDYVVEIQLPDAISAYALALRLPLPLPMPTSTGRGTTVRCRVRASSQQHADGCVREWLHRS